MAFPNNIPPGQVLKGGRKSRKQRKQRKTRKQRKQHK